MTTLYYRPTRRVALGVRPQLASWDIAGSPGQGKLGDFLDHAEAAAAPMMAAVDGPLAVELTVGLTGELSLTSGGRDLDDYIFALAQRLGSARIAAMFGQKVHGPSFLAVGRAQSDHKLVTPAVLRSGRRFLCPQRMEDHPSRTASANPARSPRSGAYRHDHQYYHWPGRNRANVWKPLIDAFGPVLGENLERPFHPNDDRITSLGLHPQRQYRYRPRRDNHGLVDESVTDVLSCRRPGESGWLPSVW
jgi:hypothetical protein